MRPRKPRFVNGVLLVDYLYPHWRGKPGHYICQLPDGTKKTISAATVERANELAIKAQRQCASQSRNAVVSQRQAKLLQHVDRYIEYRERLNPALTKKGSWMNRRYSMRQFAREFGSCAELSYSKIREWWDKLTYYQQKVRSAEFRRFFNWLMSEDLIPKLPFNPFTTADDRPRLLTKDAPRKARPALTEAVYRQIHKKAGELDERLVGLQLAMGISRYTSLRQTDICTLTWKESVRDGELRVVVGKSREQLGPIRAARLSWRLDDHPALKLLINRARELAMQNHACPYVISHKPLQRRLGKKGQRVRSPGIEKTHVCQVLPERLGKMFAQARDACGVTGVTFHEIRGLSSTLYKRHGYTDEQIMELMAHGDVETTRGYQDATQLPYKSISMTLPD